MDKPAFTTPTLVNAQAAIDGRVGRLAVFRLFELMRAASTRLSYFASAHALCRPDDERRSHFRDRFTASMPEISVPVELACGSGAIDGIHPANLAWFRAIVGGVDGAATTFRKLESTLKSQLDPSLCSDAQIIEAAVAFDPFLAAEVAPLHFRVVETVFADFDRQAAADSTHAGEIRGATEDAILRIDRIATGVRLISLNASVEAARAGDAGRGFGIIAGEVRGLADEIARASENARTGLKALMDSIAD